MAMIKPFFILLLIFLIHGFVNAQVLDSIKDNCDSVQKANIKSHIMFALAGRSVNTLIQPVDYTCEIGRFSFDIIVDRQGEVIQAELNTRFSSNISDGLKSILINSAMKSVFDTKDDAPSKQKGNITYEFKMK
jgi:hypothetical protein